MKRQKKTDEEKTMDIYYTIKESNILLDFHMKRGLTKEEATDYISDRHYDVMFRIVPVENTQLISKAAIFITKAPIPEKRVEDHHNPRKKMYELILMAKEENSVEPTKEQLDLANRAVTTIRVTKKEHTDITKMQKKISADSPRYIEEYLNITGPLYYLKKNGRYYDARLATAEEIEEAFSLGKILKAHNEKA